MEEEMQENIRTPMLRYLKADTATLAMIASYKPARITPTRLEYAYIRYPEEIAIEDALMKIKERI